MNSSNREKNVDRHRRWNPLVSFPIGRVAGIGIIVVVMLFCCLGPLASQILFPSFDDRAKQLSKLKRHLIPLHRPMGPIQSGDWLESHKELGQNFAQYVASQPVQLTSERNKLYVQPLGNFDENQRKVVEKSAEYLEIFFGCQTELLEPLGLDVIPGDARRVHPSWGVRQILSTYVLDELLPPRLPDDAVALIVLTTSDLYPADDWNFVFGQASLRGRVGVWSLFRFGDPETEFSTVLKRTLATASHETGHMFSMAHCIAYECSMCGSNNLGESDRRPMALCPECVAKVWWATDVDPVERYRKLQAFCQENGLSDTGDFYQQSLDALLDSQGTTNRQKQ